MSRDYINYKSIDCSQTLVKNLYNSILNSGKDYNKIIFLCIGTDRVIGDCLGPIVGSMLSNRKELKDKYEIIGTLHNPLHAKNLEEILETINTEDNLIIAIDSCLGDLQYIGHICINNDVVNPGGAMDKELPAVGDVSIIGIVNVSGALEFKVLQNTRLSIVYNLAAKIDETIAETMSKLHECEFLEA